jgi:6-pyruvoyltetrahydropterin/6-carboxytetrahydropterin synthase
MHKLARQIRFSVNPFLAETPEGDNSYSSKPAGQGLAVYLGLWVELMATVDPDTGFVVNVVEIDKAARKNAVPIFSDYIIESFNEKRHISLSRIDELLKETWRMLADKFGQVQLCGLALELNPFREIAIGSENKEMFYFTEKFEFAAMHKLWNDKFDEAKNFELFGKCANPAGHGHNYIVEITVEKASDSEELNIGNFQGVVKYNFIELVDHKNLNVDIDEFKTKNPTVENIAVLAWDKLSGKFGNAKLSKITIWETNKTYCTYTG